MEPKKASSKNSDTTGNKTKPTKVDNKKDDDIQVPEKRKRSPTPPTSEASLQALLKFLIHDSPSRFGAGLDAKQPNLFDLMKVSPGYTPFQDLVAAAVMSKPFSSRLGVRTLLTIFDASKERDSGIDFSTPAKMRDAGEEGRYDALSKARTQHKDKTAMQLGKLADVVIERYAQDENDTSLEKMHQKLEKDASNLHTIIKELYMFGETSADIFRRRIQATWPEAYPFADDRALKAAGYFGLPDDSASALAERVEELLPTENKDEKRKQFATVVEALAAADLEHRYEDLTELMEAAVDGEPPEKREKLE